MNSYELLQKKWKPILDHSDLPTIKDSHKRYVLAQILENTEREQRSAKIAAFGNMSDTFGNLSEASPTNAMGGSSSDPSTGAIDIFDPVLISLVRRAMPNLIAYDICGVQPMNGPT